MGELASGIKNKIELLESLIISHEYQNAIDLLLDIIDFFEDIGDVANQEKFLGKVNDCYKLLALQFREQKDFFEAAETYCSAAFLQKAHEKTDLAKQFFNDAIECYICAGKTAMSEKAYRDAAILYNSAAKYATGELQDKLKSKEYYQNAIESLQEEIATNSHEEDPSIVCRNQLELGKIYEDLEDYQTSLIHYNKAAACSIQNKLYPYTAESFQQMAHCYENLGNNSAMIDCLNKAVHYRLLEAEKYSENNLPLEAVQNFIAAANCVSQLKDSDKLLMKILESQADCFLTAAKQNTENGYLLQAAYYERDAAYCYNQLGKPETSIDLLLTAAEQLLSINEFDGAANNFQDVSIYLEQVGNHNKAANYAFNAASSAQQSGDFEFAIENFKRASQLYQSIGLFDKENICNLKIAECYIEFAELNIESGKYHITAFLYYKAAAFYSKINDQTMILSCYEKAINYYEKAITLAIADDETLLASYSACCATLVCLIMQRPTKAESILNSIHNNSSNTYYQLSDSIIKAFKTKNIQKYDEISERFCKIIQKSTEIKNMFDLAKNYL